jgi:hypothetical protein
VWSGFSYLAIFGHATAPPRTPVENSRVCVECLIGKQRNQFSSRSPSRVPYRTELIPRASAPKGRTRTPHLKNKQPTHTRNPASRIQSRLWAKVFAEVGTREFSGLMKSGMSFTFDYVQPIPADMRLRISIRISKCRISIQSTIVPVISLLVQWLTESRFPFWYNRDLAFRNSAAVPAK